MTALEKFRPLFQPARIAVVGASTTTMSGGNRFIQHLRNFGYPGQIIPIHPTAAEVEGLPALRSLADVSLTIDYAYIAVAARNAPDVLRSGRGKVLFAQVMSSGFGETDNGAALEAELVAAAREANTRLIGPNCLGVYSPTGRVTFTEKTTTEVGSVGIICQSGGLGIDIIRRGQNRGLRFSGLVTIGNAADLAASELLEYFLEDENTKVIGLYLEGTREGRRLFDVLRSNQARKPVILLKGAQTNQGQRAAASHTGALAGTARSWTALCRQTGVPMVETLDEFLDTLLVFQCIMPRLRPTIRAVMLGNGGGTSVLGSDALARAGFIVPAFKAATLATLNALKLPPGSSVTNPVDIPAGALQQDEGRIAEKIIEAVASGCEADVLLVHLNMTVLMSFRHVDMLGNIVRAALKLREHSADGMHIVLVLRSDGDPEIEEHKREYQRLAILNGVAVFDELAQAARALGSLQLVEVFRSR